MQLKEFFSGLNKKELFIIVFIFLLALGMRTNLMKYNLFFGFDSYYHARIVGDIIKGSFTGVDMHAYWQKGFLTLGNESLFFWEFSALIYKIFTFNAPYNKELWIFFVKLLPALFGALTVIAMFFFGKELFGRKAGYVTALVAAVVPSYVYRTFAGFFEDDSLGFLWLVIGLVFLARALKEPVLEKKNYINALLAGIFFGIMAWTWGFFEFVPILWTVFFVFAFITFFLAEKEKLKSFTILNAIAFVVFTVIASIRDNGQWLFNTLYTFFKFLSFSNSGINPFIFVFFILILGFFAFILTQTSKSSEKHSTKSTFIITALLYLSVLGVLFVLLDPLSIFKSKFMGAGVFAATIGEESFGFLTFNYKYNLLIIVPVLAMLLIPYRILKDKTKIHLSLLVFFWTAFSLILAYYKLKYTYLFGLPIAISAGYLSFEFFKSFNKPKLFETKIVALLFAFILITGIAAGSTFISKRAPHIETSQSYWKPALNWIKNNTPEDSKLFNWWSYGHWISFLSERTVFIDNRNADGPGDSDFARFMTSRNLKDAIQLMQKYKPDYVIYSKDLFQSGMSLLIYSYWTTNTNDPRIASQQPGFFGAAIPCSKDKTAYHCGSNVLSSQQMDSINYNWHENPDDVLQGQMPVWYYKNKDDSVLFVVGPYLNESMIAKLWFNEPETMKYFEEVYSNSGLKLFKVKPSALTVNLDSLTSPEELPSNGTDVNSSSVPFNDLNSSNSSSNDLNSVSSNDLNSVDLNN